MATDHSTAHTRIPTLQNAFIDQDPAETIGNVQDALALAQDLSRLVSCRRLKALRSWAKRMPNPDLQIPQTMIAFTLGSLARWHTSATYAWIAMEQQ